MNEEYLHRYLHNLEFRLERLMIDRGAERFRKMLQASPESTGGTPSVLKGLVEPLTKAFEAFIAEAKPKRGPKPLSLKYIEEIGPQTAAYLTLRSVLTVAGSAAVRGDDNSGNGSSGKSTLSSICRRVSHSILDELQMRKFEKENPGLFKWRLKKLNATTGNYRHRKNSLSATAGQVGVDLSEYRPGDQAEIQIGGQCIAILLSALPQAFVKEEVYINPTRSYTHILPTRELVEELVRVNTGLEMLSSDYLPTALPPLDWAPGVDGGYRFPPLRGRAKLVRLWKRLPARHKDLANVDMPVVYSALNAIQRTTWSLNTDVLDVVETIVSKGLPVPGLPSFTPIPLPKKPQWMSVETDRNLRTEEQKQELREWKRETAQVHTDNRERASKVLQLHCVLETARTIRKEYVDEQGNAISFHFVWNLDFRGRVYPVAPKLNPQGSDISRGLLRFGSGRPLGTPAAADWLAIHGANCLAESPQGEKLDKLPFEDRIEWIDRNTDAIVRVADDPFGNLWWTDADSPLQFLAWCFEWAAFVRSGRSLDFVSYIPVSMDGSCNGLQHYSALLRDEAGGEAVNLVPSGRPQDIYQRVADRVLEILRRDWTPEGENSVLAESWLQWGGINRKFVKRQVMTLPYGSKVFGFRDQIKQFVRLMPEKDRPSFFKTPAEGLQYTDYVQYIAAVIWEALGGVVESAQAGMDYFQACARLSAKSGLPLIWIAPTGFPVVNAYYDVSSRQIDTILNGKVVFRPSMTEHTDKIDARKQVSSAPPNIIHSLDAAALMFAVDAAKKEGIDHFLTVHDCFGTHAANAPALARIVRETFVGMYREDILGRLAQNLTADVPEKHRESIPEPPALGTLDLNGVLESKYFFA